MTVLLSNDLITTNLFFLKRKVFAYSLFPFRPKQIFVIKILNGLEIDAIRNLRNTSNAISGPSSIQI